MTPLFLPDKRIFFEIGYDVEGFQITAAAKSHNKNS